MGSRIAPDHVGVKLFVPAAVQRRGRVEAPPVQTELQHLRTSSDTLPLRWTQVRHRTVGTDVQHEEHLNPFMSLQVQSTPVPPPGVIV